MIINIVSEFGQNLNCFNKIMTHIDLLIFDFKIFR